MGTIKPNLNSSKSASVDRVLKIFKELLIINIFVFSILKAQNTLKMICSSLRIKLFYMLPMEKILIRLAALGNSKLSGNWVKVVLAKSY